MASANCKITAELISDYAAGRLEVEDVRVMEEAINHDEDVAAAVGAANRWAASPTGLQSRFPGGWVSSVIAPD